MRNSAEFARAFKGVRSASPRLLVAIGSELTESGADLQSTKVGFVIPKSVGNSVVRHRLYRQLRHVVRARFDLFTPEELVVVRAFPQARGVSSRTLAADLERCVDSIRRKMARNQAEGVTR